MRRRPRPRARREVCYNTGRLSNPSELSARYTLRAYWMRGVVATAMLIVAISACGDSTEPILLPLPEEGEEVELTDFISGSLVDPSAFDLITRSVIRTDQYSGWDFVFFLDETDGPVLVSRGAYTEDEDNEAGMQVVLSSFDGLVAAPEDGYVVLDPVPISVGDVFVTRSRQDQNFGGLRCRYFGKFEIETIDETEGTLTLIHLVNPNCENRNLDPSLNP